MPDLAAAVDNAERQLGSRGYRTTQLARPATTIPGDPGRRVTQSPITRGFEHAWERDASLRLRRGDVDVLDVYDTHHRIHSVERNGAAAAILDAWQHARGSGESVALLATSNGTVEQLNTLAQRRRIAAGELDATRHVTAGVYRIRVGDRIVTRRNDRDLQTDRGLAVHNRDEWIVTKLHRGGGLTATRHNGTIRLPAAYVNEAVELGYAQTSHAAQGRTVDHSLVLIDGPTDQRGVYVPMTRGRTENHVYVIVDENRTARDILETALSQDWIDRPAHVRRNELNPEPVAAVEREREPLAPDDIRRLLETEHELAKRINAHDDTARRAPGRIAAAENAHSEAINEYEREIARRDKAQATLDRCDRIFHRRDHTIDIEHARSERQFAESHLPRLRDTIGGRAADLARIVEDARKVERDQVMRPESGNELAATRNAIADDLIAHARKTEHMPSIHALCELPHRPCDPDLASLWDHTAALLDQHHTAFGPEISRDHGQPHGADAYTASRDGTRHAIDHLDRVIHPRRERLRQLVQDTGRDPGHEHDAGIEM